MAFPIPCHFPYLPGQSRRDSVLKPQPRMTHNALLSAYGNGLCWQRAVDVRLGNEGVRGL